MARRRQKRTLRPRVPSRIRKKKRKGKTRGHQHPELIGLGLVALGLFLATLRLSVRGVSENWRGRAGAPKPAAHKHSTASIAVRSISFSRPAPFLPNSLWSGAATA